MNCNWQFVVENWPSLVADLAACEKERDEFKMAMLDAADRAEKAEAELAECQRLQPCDCGRAVDVDGNRIHYPPCVYSELAALREELADYKEYYEWLDNPVMSDLAKAELIFARIEARREKEVHHA